MKLSYREAAKDFPRAESSEIGSSLTSALTSALRFWSHSFVD